jgi:hypothetical protein
MRKFLVLCAAVALVASFSVTAMAAEWNFFGDVKFRTFWARDTANTFWVGGDGGQAFNSNALFSDSDMHWGHSVGTAFGGSVQAGDIGGFVAMRPLENSIHVFGGDFFQIYGTWNFGAGTLLVGKTFGPVNWFGSNMVFLDENCCLGFGGILSYVKPLIQVSFDGDWGIFKFAALQPEGNLSVFPIGGIPHFQMSNSTGVVGNPFVDNDTSWPKLEASYANTWGPIEATLMGGWQTIDGVMYNANATAETDHSIDSWVVALGLKFNMGPFYINGDVLRGQNLGQYQFTFQLGDDDARWSNTTNSVIDNKTWGWMIAAGYKINDMFALEAGYGYTKHDLDTPGRWQDTTQGYYLQCQITLAKGVTITPEIGKLDWMDSSFVGPNAGVADQDQGDTTWFGAQWRITF